MQKTYFEREIYSEWKIRHLFYDQTSFRVQVKMCSAYTQRSNKNNFLTNLIIFYNETLLWWLEYIRWFNTTVRHLNITYWNEYMQKINAKNTSKGKIQSIKWEEEGTNICLTSDYTYCLFQFYYCYKHDCLQVFCLFPDSRTFASMARYLMD